MLKLKKVSAAFVLSLILGVSLFSTGAFAKTAQSVQSAQNTHVAGWCGCHQTIIFLSGFWDFGFFPWFSWFGF